MPRPAVPPQRPNYQQVPRTNFHQAPRPAVPAPNQCAAHKNREGLVCFNCSEPGHFASRCPYKKRAPAAGGAPQAVPNRNATQGPQQYAYGKVNHVTTEDAQEAAEVVLGMFLANSNPATILFDSGASHSFISSGFVAKYNLPIPTMTCTMLVSSPGGEMRTRHLCPAVSLKIKGG